MQVRETAAGLEFDVRVQPRARRTEVAGVIGEALRIRLTAPPVDGEANRALIAFLARQLGVRQADVEIVAGQTARNKRVRVRGCSVAQWQQWING